MATLIVATLRLVVEQEGAVHCCMNVLLQRGNVVKKREGTEKDCCRTAVTFGLAIVSTTTLSQMGRCRSIDSPASKAISC